MISFFGRSKKLALLFLVPLLSACVDGGTRPGGPGGYYPPQRPWPDQRPPQQQMCTMEYRPVCGERGGRLQTFGNSCQAGAQGYRIVSPGECGRGPGAFPPPGRPDGPGRPDHPDWNPPGRPDRPDRPDYGRPDRPDRPDWNQPGRPDRPGRPEQSGICTREYRPVCGQSGGRTQTFPNGCEAANAGFSVVSSGECRR